MSYSGDYFLDAVAKQMKCCLNCKNYEEQGMIGYCELFHKTITNNTMTRVCYFPKEESSENIPKGETK